MGPTNAHMEPSNVLVLNSRTANTVLNPQTCKTNKYLVAVNEFSQRNVGPFAEDIDGMEVISGPILELEVQRVLVVRK